MNNKITIEGRIYFDPNDVTKKHESQSTWKKMALISIKGDLSKYYAWFIKKRFNLDLTDPLRGAHISFINDRATDMNGKWEEVKKKYHKKKIKIVLDIRPHATKSNSYNQDGGHWWLIVPHDERGELQSIRNELGLDKPFFGMHMTIGKAVDKRADVKLDSQGTNAKKMNVAHSDYILDLIDKGLIKF
jgi:hypothetical protein